MLGIYTNLFPQILSDVSLPWPHGLGDSVDVLLSRTNIKLHVTISGYSDYKRVTSCLTPYTDSCELLCWKGFQPAYVRKRQ